MRKRAAICLLVAAALAWASCRSLRVEKRLEGEDALFLSQVRPIMTKEEKRRFLEMPKADRAEFKAEFWKKRDPDPDTEINEFRTEYLERLAEADRLFSAGKPGRLTDRGRTLILLGPPVNKSFYPMGNAAEDLRDPSEVWHYPDLPVVFIDRGGTGAYEFYFTSLAHQAKVLEAMLTARRLSSGEAEALFDYDVGLRRLGGRNAVVIRLERQDLWMTDEGGTIETTLEIKLQLRDPSDRIVWERMLEHPVSLPGEEMGRGSPEPDVLTFDLDLPPGKYSLIAWVKNRADGELRSKTKAVRIS